MKGFVLPIVPSEVDVVGVAEVALADYPPLAVATGERAIVRDGYARFAGATLLAAQLRMKFPTVGVPTLGVKAPARGTLRLAKAAAGAVDLTMLEFSPFPFALPQAALDAFGFGDHQIGLPTFYIGAHTASILPPPAIPVDLLADDTPGYSIQLSGSDCFFGVIFQDRMQLPPWTWARVIAGATRGAGLDATTAQAWLDFGEAIAAKAVPLGGSLRVIDHFGAALSSSVSFEVVFPDATVPVTLDAASADLVAAVHPRSLFGPGRSVQLRATNPALSVLSLYETGQSAPPGGTLTLPPAPADGSLPRFGLQLLDLGAVLADPLGPPTPSSAMARFWPNCRVEPIVDGLPSFARMVEDFRAAHGSGNGIQLAGWHFNHDVPLLADADLHSTLLDIVTDLQQGGAKARFLFNKFVNFRQNPTQDIEKRAAIAIALLVAIAVAGAALAGGVGGGIASGILAGALPLLGYFGGGTINQTALEKLSLVEKNQAAYDALNRLGEQLAFFSKYPARIHDNPLRKEPFRVQALALDLDTLIDNFGSWHQKFQLVRRTPVDGSAFVAYVGGIEIDGSRLDTPGHHRHVFVPPSERGHTPTSINPFHDVHARLTGPAVGDIITTFVDRFRHNVPDDTAHTPLAFEPPSSDAELRLDESKNPRHLVQVARTLAPATNEDGTVALAYAPQGDDAIFRNLIAAIRSAREYIYIEDQYFSPDSNASEFSATNRTSDRATTYLNVLLQAGDQNRKLRLLVIFPDEADQFLGGARRADVYHQLKAVFGDRFLMGSAQRRPFLPNPGPIVSAGRCVLAEDIDASTASFAVAPASRVPDAPPFWLWIDGELMYAQGTPSTPDTSAVPTTRKLTDVTRGQFGAHWRAHKKGAGVTMAMPKGIYVHSKIMMVDDVYVSIGSANINRRGLFHDGELTIHTIPEQLRCAPDNPARALRTRLWAEHLGLSPSMGAALLGDPIAAFELFRRSYFTGNRFVAYEDRPPQIQTAVSFTGGVVSVLLGVLQASVLDPLLGPLWNTLIDPTATTDPDPELGP